MGWLAGKTVGLWIRLGITHNQITFFPSIVFLTLAAVSFAQGTYWWGVTGIFFAFCHSFFDFIDGELARKTSTSNKLGAWSDPAFDKIGSGLLLLGVAIGVLRNHYSLFWLSITVLALFGHYGVQVLSHYYDGKIYGPVSEEIVRQIETSKTTIVDYIIKELVFLRSFPVLFFGTLRYSLVLFILLNTTHYFVVVYAIVSNIRWMLMFFIYTQVLNQPGTKIPQVNLKVVEIIKQFVFRDH